MQLQDIRKMAQGFGIKPGKMTKTTLVRELQLCEGNFDCFATACEGECDQTGCFWREDCFTESKRELAAA